MKRIVVLALVFGVPACAQVPKEAIELSTTVGKDIAEAHRAHVELARLLFGRMKDDVHRFVDEVYMPHQVQVAFDAEAGKERNSLFKLISYAFSEAETAEEQQERAKARETAVKAMGIFSRRIHQDVENYRRKLLTPIEEQEAALVGSIDAHYQKVQNGHSVVAGHLASVAKVHQAQQEALGALGIDADLRSMLGGKLAKASDQLGELVDDAQAKEGALDDAIERIENLLGVEKDADGND